MKTLRNILMIIVFLAINYGITHAQCNIHLMAIPSEQGENIPDDINDMLMTRLTSAITATGVTASPDLDRFFVTGKISHLYKDVVPGPPISNIMHSTLTLYIGDVISKKVYATTSFELRGVGTSESRAFINAMRLLNAKNSQFNTFVENGTKKILDYYNKEYPLLIKQAKQAESMRQYEKALSFIATIPECCKGYDQAYNALLSIYNNYINYDGEMLLNQAKAAWSASPDEDGAQKAYMYLTQIDPDSKCYDQAQALHNEIKKVVKENWDFEVKEKYQNEIDIERRKIEAARAIGVAFGNGQKETTTNLMWLK